jgi:pyruvate dehydrogenase E2 component (dihydrolipoamide acetyltransferase)
MAARAMGTVPAGAAAGSGLGGRITAADMASGAAFRAAVKAGATVAAASAGIPDEYTDEPMKGVRKVVASRMYKSLAESAQLTLNAQANASKMQELRKKFKASDEKLGLQKITINDLVMFAVTRTLPRFPYMNAHMLPDPSGKGWPETGVVRTFSRIHLGCAVDTPRGLLVPVIRNADLMSLKQISDEAKRLAKGAQDGKSAPDELSGSTFTVTNIGSMGITSFTPVINAPEVAILGVCNIQPHPVETTDDDGCCGYTFEPFIGLSLTINHQVVDGAPGARFLKALCETIENIDMFMAI